MDALVDREWAESPFRLLEDRDLGGRSRDIREDVRSVSDAVSREEVEPPPPSRLGGRFRGERSVRALAGFAGFSNAAISAFNSDTALDMINSRLMAFENSFDPFIPWAAIKILSQPIQISSRLRGKGLFELCRNQQGQSNTNGTPCFVDCSAFVFNVFSLRGLFSNRA